VKSARWKIAPTEPGLKVQKMNERSISGFGSHHIALTKETGVRVFPSGTPGQQNEGEKSGCQLATPLLKRTGFHPSEVGVLKGAPA
jgi:hypothetical protein